MDIRYLDLEYPDYSLAISQRGEVHVIQVDYGSTCDNYSYRLVDEAPKLPLNKTKYFTETSGFVTAKTYLGCFSVNVTDIPEYVQR